MACKSAATELATISIATARDGASTDEMDQQLRHCQSCAHVPQAALVGMRCNRATTALLRTPSAAGLRSSSDDLDLARIRQRIPVGRRRTGAAGGPQSDGVSRV